MKGLFLTARYTCALPGLSLNLNQKGCEGQGPNIPELYGGRQDTEPTTIHFTSIAKALFKFRGCLYCITWTKRGSLCTTINFLEKHNCVQASQREVAEKARVGRPGGQVTHLSPPWTPQPFQDRTAVAPSTAALFQSKKSYSEPPSCQKLFPGDFDPLMR